MSHFSTMLSTALAARDQTQLDVEKATGIDRSVLSRMMAGTLAPSRTNLSRLAKKFPPGSTIGNELLFAHLRDEAEAAGMPAEQLEIFHSPLGQNFWESLPGVLKSDLYLLATEAVKNNDFARLITDWATVISSHHAALERKVYPFPQSTVASAVAEDSPSHSSKGPRHARPAPAVPRSDSQRIEPTA